ncbi:MAG TPA: TetR/AcrR family transcriptional regulator [Acidimicrobiales bacterium]|jgi:AcrR family transcriptional regulator|nr:TetR/AcrR family transcriptional regulator [Acidimicrobiales bacterium]
MAPTSAPPPRTKGEQTRRDILRAAVARFGRDGYRATSVADIAREAGVGGTVPYAYFANKEALFLAAVDEDAAAVIHEALSGAFDDPDPLDWQDMLLVSLLDAVDRHPLARRLLAGLEPEVTPRVLHVPALEELRKATAERLATDQVAGIVRPDVDPTTMAEGMVAIVMSLLMSVVQLGLDATSPYAASVAAVLESALKQPPAGG